MAGKGGRTPGAGRKPGVPNKATAEVKDLARVHGAAAIKRLSELLTGAESEQAQVAAAKELLDRGYGKASQPIEHSGTLVEELLDRLGTS